MRLVADTTGRFSKRPHYAPAELDRECEQLISAFLKERHGKAEYPVTTDDLTVLIESKVQNLDLYADLSTYGDSVEGITIFVPSGKPKVKIDKGLSESPSRSNRFRTTLTHEFGHVYFHAYLFEEKANTRDLFSAKPAARDTVQVCKRDTILDARHADWMEWQAGHVCGAILMPASVVRRAVTETVASLGDTSLEIAESHVIAMVMKRFEVSEDAARVRLARLGLLGQPVADTTLFK